MPVSPYISQNTYATRPYSRGNSSYGQTPTVTSSYGISKYYGGDTTTTSVTTGYKTGGYGKLRLPIPEESTYDLGTTKHNNYFPSPSAAKPPPYAVGRYKSSDNIPESQTLLELKLKKSNSNSALLRGNTANILKSFNKFEDTSPTSIYPPRPKYSDRLEERKYGGKGGGPSVFASHYLAKINTGREFRPREIDTRDINITDKPRVAPGFKSNIEDENYGAITRNSRHVVRLTIKREEADDPFVVKDKTIKTIAQRLIEKYTEKEKKTDPYVYVPRRRLYEDYNQEKDEKAVGVGTSTPSPIVTSSIASDTTANNVSKDSNVSVTSRKKSLADIRAAMSQQNSFEEEESDVAARLLRATSMAAKKKELENPEDVKDAIIAAVLHPDVDIESDEEMRELVQGSRGKTKEWANEAGKKVDGETSDCLSDEGKNIVGQLKRYVKKQVSTKRSSKKRSSEKKSSRTSSKKSKKERNHSERQQGDNITVTNHKEEEEEESKQTSTQESKKEESSLLSSDLVFGSSKKHKKSKEKSNKSKGEGSKITEDNQGKIPTGNRGNKSGLSLLSADLVFNNLTSDEENDSRPKTPVTLEKANDEVKRKEKEKEDRQKKEKEQEDNQKKEKERQDNLKKDIKEDIKKKEKEKEDRQKKEKEKEDNLKKEREKEERKKKEKEREDNLKKEKDDIKKKEKEMEDRQRKEKKKEDIQKKEKEKEDKQKKDKEREDNPMKEKDILTNVIEKEETINNQPKDNSELERTKMTEKVVSKIPKIKRKSKRTAATAVADAEESTKVLPKIKVSPVASPPSEIPLKGHPEVKEKVAEFQEARDSDTASGINKKITSKTSRTGNSNETSDHGLQSTSSAGSKKSILGKEIKSARSEKSSGDGRREKVSEEKSIMDLSAEFKTSKKLEEKEWALTNKDIESLTSNTTHEKNSTLNGQRSPKIIEEKSSSKADEIPNKKEKEITGEVICNKKEIISGVSPEVACILKEDIQYKESVQDNTETRNVRDEAIVSKKEDDNSKTQENKEDNKESIANEATDTGKKAFKRPRQVGPPPPQESTIGTADLLNARKILKRPVKKIGVEPAPEETKEQPTAPEDVTKKLWKRPIAQLVPPKEGDQFLQARNVLKKPVKPKPEEKNDKPTGKFPEIKVVKFKKGGAAAAKEGAARGDQKPRSRSPSSSDEEGEEGAKKADRPRRPLKPRPAGDKKSPSPPGSAIEKIPILPESSSITKKLEGSGKSPSKTKETSGSYGQDPKLSACQSADSGYGSSPSTPQPTQTSSDAKDEEICTVCGTNCHKKCEKQMANLCGVNQKLLAEALSSVKKAGSADGTSRTIGSPTKSSSVSGSESETTTEEESETDTDTDYFGLPEIRPPLQTRPKFKKYTIDDFLFVKVLGKGSYGKVMLAQQKESENYFAVKCLKKDVVLEDNDIECTLIERKVLSLGTKHPYLCHLFCTFQTPSHLFFVMEYLTGGDLMFHIQHCGRFDEFRSCFYAAEITSGLKFLHSKGIIYRDLKLDNILLDYQGHIRIADFGMCKLQVYLDRYADTFCGTPDYMAPEVIKGQHYNQCVDWWSFGVLLYEMMTGKSPFKGCDEDHLFWLICNDEPFYPKFLSLEATDILKGLLDKDSNRRLGIPFSPYGEIKDHPFFKYTDWGKIERKEVETPYKPRLRHILDVQYFDKLFTKRQAALTPLDESILATMDQTAFTDFSYTNPNITD